MSAKPDPAHEGKLAPTGRLVKDALAGLKAPASFREALRTSLVHQPAGPGPTGVSAGYQSGPAAPSPASGGTARGS